MNLKSPAAIAVGAAVIGIGSALAGVFLLAGLGWALIAASAPLIALSAITFRGLLRAATPQ